MKHIRIFTLLLTAAVFPIVPHLHAQEAALKAEVPFDFAVGDKMLPAGDYLIFRQGVFLRIQNRNTDSGLYVIPNAGEVAPNRQPRLRFHYLNGLYFLKSIAASSSANSAELPTSLLEKQAKEMEQQTYAANFGR
jgi:hypothetical protein